MSDCLHVQVMPYGMAKRKPYFLQSRHEAWQDTVPAMNSDAPFAEIAERIRWHRELVALRQIDYAKKAGIQRSALANWESGQQRVSLDGGLALRRTYGLSLDFIFEGIADTLPMSLRQAWIDRPDDSASK
jgi:DNA-binding XRE family transcriptional regulator